jgi:5-formyltetrahydrofolate cyclo-ligase
VREDAHRASAENAGAVLAARQLPVVPDKDCSVISAYHSLGTEISTCELFDALVSAGWTTALPIVVGKNTPLVFRQWTPGEPLLVGRWDIKIPSETAREVIPDVLLVPLLAFDRQGYRLGYGGGFYDRTLEQLRAQKKVKAIGLAYAAQEVDSVLHDEHDQRLDWIMTERETIPCG